MRLEFLCQTCGVIVEADSELGGDLVDCPECGATIMVPMDVVGSGMIVGGYKVLSKLGTGGMGDVYLAEHATMQRRVALKVLPPAMTRDRNAAERFLQEVRNQAALNHPNIATAYDAGRDREIFYLAMEYVEGVDIQRILSKKSIMPERESLRVALEVARGLDYAWYRKKIIHRDVKPANIMISKDADVQLLDMGLSRSMGDMDLSDTNFIIGTPLYMSPEQTDPDAQLDFRSDMYSLGSTLYHMLCGKTPYEGKTVAQILAARALREPVHIREVNPAISETCAAVVHTMLARDPAQRFSDWATAIAGITQALSGHQNASTSLITGIPDQPAADQQPVKKELPRVVPTMHAPTEQKPNPMIQVYLVALGVVALALITGLVALLKLPPRVNEADTQVASHAPVTPSVAPTNTIASLPSANPTPQTPAPAKTNELAEAQAAEQQRAVLALERMARETEAAQNDIRAEYTERLAAMRQRPEDHAGHVSALQALAPRAGSLELASLEQEIQDAIAGLKNERSQALDAIRVEIQQAIDSSLEKADYPAALQAVTAYSGPLQQETTDLRKDLEMQTNTRIERLQTEVREREQRAAEGYATLVDHLASFIISNQASQVKTHLEAAIKAPELEPVKAKLEELDSTLDLLNGLDEKILLTFKSQVGQTIEIETPDGPVLFVIKQVGTNSITVTRQVEDNGPIVGSIEMKLNPRDLSGAERVKRIEESFGSDADFVLGCLALRAQREQTALSYFKNSERDLSTALASRLVPIIKIKEAAVRKAAGEQVEREARWAFSSLLHSAM
ncbi:MAG: DNA-directed RNA polymerase subunit RPC12/RpoP, partial [Verrucomicrobiales bacterium]